MKVDYERYWKNMIRKRYTYSYRHYEITRVIRTTKSFGRVLDLGCGGGYALKLLPNSFVKYGCDVSETALKLIKDLNITVKKWDLNEGFPFDMRFDFIICSEVLEHLEVPSNVLENVKRHLAEGGLFLVTIPNVMHLKHRISMLLGRLPDYDKTHINFWNLEEFTGMLTDHGYKILKFFPTYYPFPFVTRTFFQILSKIQGRKCGFGNNNRIISTYRRILFELFGEQFLFICCLEDRILD